MSMRRMSDFGLFFAAFAIMSESAFADQFTLLCRFIETDMLSGGKRNAELYVTLDLASRKYMFAHTMDVSDMKGVSDNAAVLVGIQDGNADGEAFIVSIGRQDGKYTSVVKTNEVHLVSSGKCVPSELIPFPQGAKNNKLF